MIDRLERFNIAVGRASAWLTLFMVLTTVAVVLLRYVFDVGWIWLQESVVWMHASTFMLAAAYTFAREEHVRVDIFYAKMSERGKAWVDSLGTILFLLPFTGFVIWVSWDYVGTSWSIRESSGEAGGLPFPLPAMLKSLIIISALMLQIQAVVMLARSVSRLSGRQS